MFSTMSIPFFPGSTNSRPVRSKTYSQSGPRNFTMPIFKGPTLSSFPYTATGTFDLGYIPEQATEVRRREVPTIMRSSSRSSQYMPPVFPTTQHSDDCAPVPVRSKQTNYSFHQGGTTRDMFIYNPSASSKSDATEYDETSTLGSYASPALSSDSTMTLKSPLFIPSSLADNDTPDTSPSSSLDERGAHMKPHDMNGWTSQPQDLLFNTSSANTSNLFDREKVSHRTSTYNPPSEYRSRTQSTGYYQPGSIPTCIRQPDPSSFTRPKERDPSRRQRKYSTSATTAPYVGKVICTDSDLDLLEQGFSKTPAPHSERRPAPYGVARRDEGSDHSSPFLAAYAEQDTSRVNISQSSIPTVTRSPSPDESVLAQRRKSLVDILDHPPPRLTPLTAGRAGNAESNPYIPRGYSEPSPIPVPVPSSVRPSPYKQTPPTERATPISASPQPPRPPLRHPSISISPQESQPHRRRTLSKSGGKVGDRVASPSSSSSKHSNSEEERAKFLSMGSASYLAGSTSADVQPMQVKSSKRNSQAVYNTLVAHNDAPITTTATITRSSTTSKRTTTDASGTTIKVNKRTSCYEVVSPSQDGRQVQLPLAEEFDPITGPLGHAEILPYNEKPEVKRRSSDSDAVHHSLPHRPQRRYTDPPQMSALKRGVRWDDNLICPSPIFPHQRRKGWYNRKGEQLWTNDGAFKSPIEGDEYPLDLAEYPDCGEGWMNEEGIRIDINHRLVPKTPLKPALKRRI